MGRPSGEVVERRRRELSEKQLAFVSWLAVPPSLRRPAGKEDLAAALGTNRQTLWRWERDPRVVEAARVIVLQNAGDPDRVVSVLDMLHGLALERRDKGAAEVWLKAVGVMGSQSSRDLALWDDVSDEALDLLSDEALEALRLMKEAELLEREAVAGAKAKLGSPSV